MEELSNEKNIKETDDSNVAVENNTTEKSKENDKENGKETKEKSSLLSDTIEIFETVIISVFIVLLVFAYIARPVTVDGRSMYPTLDNMDRLIMRTIFYKPQVGDVVILDNQNSYTFDGATGEVKEGTGLRKRLIKRVIATEGQTIDIDFITGEVTVDGEVLNENYILEKTNYDAHAFQYPITVPDGYVFVMGDNRNNSTDSRSPHVGFVKEEDVLGEAIARFYPFSEFKFID